MSPKDVAESFETIEFDVKDVISRPMDDWDKVYSHDADRHLYPPIQILNEYPKGSTLKERIEMRKANLPKGEMINTQWGIRPA